MIRLHLETSFGIFVEQLSAFHLEFMSLAYH